jgi:hypothetical protein
MRHFFLKVCAPRFASERTRSARLDKSAIQLLHCALLEQNLRYYTPGISFDPVCAMPLPSVVKERLPHARWGAELVWSRLSGQQKTRRQAPGQSVHTFRDGVARSSTSFYPLFVPNLTSVRPNHKGRPPVAAHQTGNLTAREYSSFPDSVKPVSTPVLQHPLWNSQPSVEIHRREFFKFLSLEKPTLCMEPFVAAPELLACVLQVKPAGADESSREKLVCSTRSFCEGA